MHIERMHRTIKYIYLKGKTGKRLDKTIGALMHFIRDQLFSRLIFATKGKVSSKIADLRKAHSLSLSENLTVSKVGNVWEVLERKIKYIVTQTETHSSHTCQLICGDCRICIHQYVCTCYTSTIKWNMCKHVHFVAKVYNHRDKDEGVEETTAVTQEDNSRSNILEAVLPSIVKPEQTVDSDMNKIMAKMSSIVQSVTTVQETSLILKNLSKLQAELEVLKSGTSLGLNQEEKTVIGKKRKISPQRRLIPVKTKHQKKRQTEGPTKSESETIKTNLVLSLL